jgi:hypothetical protein
MTSPIALPKNRENEQISGALGQAMPEEQKISKEEAIEKLKESEEAVLLVYMREDIPVLGELDDDENQQTTIERYVYRIQS